MIFAGTRPPAHGIALLDALLVPLTTLPIAARRYWPLAVLAITVTAETLLLLFSAASRSRSA